MNSIHLLPEHLINQIKAGEVIERPAHLLKELLENSVDAGSTKISLRIKNNCLDYLSINDNGKGISKQDLPFAFARHATSKIQNFSDLYKLKSYGFRGEALASISSIAKVTCDTKTKNSPASKYTIHGGESIAIEESNKKETGTLMVVEELFFNTPVRLKFVKTKNSEKNALKKVVYAFILSFPHISFDMKWDDEPRQFFPPMNSALERLSRIFPKHFKDGNAISIEEEYEEHQVRGILSSTSNKATRTDFQFIFINNRLITDRSLHQTVVKAMEPIWGKGRSGAYSILLTIPESSLDVNIHPNKTVVKFENSSVVFSLIFGAIEKSVRSIPKEDRFTENVDSEYFSENSLHFADKNIWQAEFEIMQITSTHFIIKKSLEQIYLLDIKSILESILAKETQEDDEIMPLLIAVPLNLTLDDTRKKIVKDLSKKGFSFSGLEDGNLILSAIPSLLSFFDYQNISLQILSGDKNIDYSQLSSPLSSLENFILKEGLENLIKQGFLSNFKVSQFSQPNSEQTCQI
jgi:DNA mismatch repair protein MutL